LSSFTTGIEASILASHQWQRHDDAGLQLLFLVGSMAQSTSSQPCARQPYSRPQHPTNPLILEPSPRLIQFLHPGYPPINSLLLALPALDGDGIHHLTAFYACAIVAGNCWDGYFSLDQEGNVRVQADPQSSLTAGKYYFQVPSADGTSSTAGLLPQN
jgi:hypothetical protein